MPNTDVPLSTILERFKANEKHILAATRATTTHSPPTSTTAPSPPSPPLSPTTRPATPSQLTLAPRAAILVGLFTHPTTNQVSVLLTLRASNMTSHQGEVALPGGRRDAADGGDDVVTALREAEEEVGLERSLVGEGPFVRTRRVFSKKGLVVSPIVAPIPVPSYIASAPPGPATSSSVATFTPHLNGSEVAAMFCLPLHTFLSSTDYRYEDRAYDIYTYRMHYFTRRTAEWIEVDPEPPLPPSALQSSAAGGGIANWRVGEGEREFLVWGMTAGVLVACAKVAFGVEPEFAVPALTAKRGEQPTAPQPVNAAGSEEGTVSQSNL